MKCHLNLPGSVFLRRGCSLLAVLLLLLVPLFTWLLACCWSLSGVFVVLSCGSDASRRRGEVGVGGAPLAMLLRLDVELLRLPGPDKTCQWDQNVPTVVKYWGWTLLTLHRPPQHSQFTMLYLHENLNEEYGTSIVTGCVGMGGRWGVDGYNRQSITCSSQVTFSKYIKHGILSIRSPINTGGQTGKSNITIKVYLKWGL